jgi:hypothetical protein
MPRVQYNSTICLVHHFDGCAKQSIRRERVLTTSRSILTSWRLWGANGGRWYYTVRSTAHGAWGIQTNSLNMTHSKKEKVSAPTTAIIPARTVATTRHMRSKSSKRSQCLRFEKRNAANYHHREEGFATPVTPGKSYMIPASEARQGQCDSTDRFPTEGKLAPLMLQLLNMDE